MSGSYLETEANERIAELEREFAELRRRFDEAPVVVLKSIGEGEYYCFCNQYGAVSVTAQNGIKLGLKPGEFEVLEWTENAAYVLQNPTYAELLEYAAGQPCQNYGTRNTPKGKFVDCGLCVPCRARIAKANDGN